MNKKILIILTLFSTLVADEIWVDDIAALYYGQKMLKEVAIKDKKLTQDEISKLSYLKDNNIFELQDKRLPEDSDALFVELKRVYYTKTPFGTKKISKDKAKIPLKSFESVSSIKEIYKSDAIKLFKAPFELSPRAALKSLEVGDKIRLIVTSYGRPKAGVSITYDKKVVAKSDRDGFVSVEIKKTGFQKITASYSQKGDGIKCDEIVHTTTLSIEIKR